MRRQFDISGSNQDRNVIIDSFSPTGTKTRLFNSANSSLVTSGLDSFTSTSRLIHNIGDDKLYVILCHNTGSYTTNCNSSYSPKVLAIDLTSSTDYPRSHTFVSEGGTGILDYVALGDSYSSGEGVPNFVPPTDSNECHRSYDAYPVLMHWENSNMRLRAFRACSGATAESVAEGINGEPGQLDSLNSSTDVVTITIGGNDIGFSAYAHECVNPLGECVSYSDEYIAAMAVINGDLDDRLDTLFASIHTEAPNAEVYVGGYPYLTTNVGCYWMNNSEATTARSLVESLNSVIANAVIDAASGYFHYVDPQGLGSPFLGHELCTLDSYINDVNLSHTEYSFHPNDEGQAAYAELFAEMIS